MSFLPPAAPGPPPGWYLDHASQQWIWWDGWRWVPPPPAAPPESERTWFPETPRLAIGAAVAGIAFVIVLTVVSRLTVLLPDTPGAIAALGLLAVSTLGMPGLAWYGSRRWGTGRFFGDLGFRVSWIDVPLGIAAAIVLTITLTILNVIIHLIGVPNGSNFTEIAENGRDAFVFVSLFVTAGLLAPVTEELLFRGLILRGLSSRWSTWAGVAIQAVVFGAAHLTPSEGWGNVDLIVSLAVMGFGLGALARLTGRLGTGIIAHAVFNCIQLGLLWLALG